MTTAQTKSWAILTLEEKTALNLSLTLEKSTSGRLPISFQRFLEPADVARKTVDGMRREYEYIYLPSVIPFILLSD